ncbi:MAG: hypothetical protein QNK11_06310 [Legionella sp.]|nr:hypothetical protein [Legionella sp.]
MEHAKIKLCAQKAYILHIDTSGLSLTEKLNRFSRFFAYEVAFSGFPEHGDIAGCIAAHHLLSLVSHDYAYALNRERASVQLSASSAEYERALGMTTSTATTEQIKLTQPMQAHEIPEFNLENDVFHHNQAVLDRVKTDYMRAYCIAFLLFEEATKTQTQQAFESCIEKTLKKSFSDPYSYSNALFQFMMCAEVSMLMSMVMILGLAILALPTAGFSALPVITTYAIGGSMTASGAVYHTCRFFVKHSEAGEAQDVNMPNQALNKNI